MNAPDRQIEAAEGYVTLGMTEDARKILTSLPPALRRSKRALVLHLEILMMFQKWGKAATLAKSLCRLEPDDTERHVQVGGLLVNAGRNGAALDWLEMHRLKCDHLPAFHYTQAKCHAALDQVEAAKQALKRALQIQASLPCEEDDSPVIQQPFEGALDCAAAFSR